MKTAIVTGANGFVGSWLVRELIKNGFFVYAIVKNESSDLRDLDQLKNVQIIYCELQEILDLDDKLNIDRIDLFFHFAWAGTSGMDRANYELQLNNVQYTCDAVKAAKKLKCEKFVFAGSIMEYESMSYVPEDGADPGLANIYSTAKLSANFMAKTLAVHLGLSYISIIISNIYGVGETSKRLINTTIEKFLNKEKTDFTAGTQLYDFIYIADAVRAIYLAGELGLPYTNYYIGNPRPKPLKEFIMEMRDCIDKDMELSFGGIPFNGPYLKYTEFDTGKLQKEFNFHPEISFQEGIKKTVEWMRDQKEKQK